MITLLIISFSTLFQPIQSDQCYKNAYDYLLADQNTKAILGKTFRKSMKKKEIKSLTFCIDTFAYALTLNGFSQIGEDVKEIRKADYGSVPSELVSLSRCNCENVTYNLTASIINKDYLTLEVSSRKFNPIGGASFGPSVKFLFSFDENYDVKSVWHQSYMNG